MEDAKIISAFGRVLKKAREDKGISQEVLAHGIRSHSTHISRLENGHKQPTLTTIFKLAEVLDIDPVDIIKSIQSQSL